MSKRAAPFISHRAPCNFSSAKKKSIIRPTHPPYCICCRRAAESSSMSPPQADCHAAPHLSSVAPQGFWWMAAIKSLLTGSTQSYKWLSSRCSDVLTSFFFFCPSPPASNNLSLCHCTSFLFSLFFCTPDIVHLLTCLNPTLWKKRNRKTSKKFVKFLPLSIKKHKSGCRESCGKFPPCVTEISQLQALLSSS